MSNKRPYIILIIVAILVYLILNRWNKSGQNVSWAETYTETSKAPYGSFALFELLKTYFPNQKFVEIKKGIEEELIVDESTKANYFFIGEAQYLDTSDVYKLLSFAEKGNNVMVISKTIPFDLMDKIYFKECNEHLWDELKVVFDTTADVALLHPNLKKESYHYTFYRNNKEQGYFWHYVDSVYICDKPFSFVPLGTLNDTLTNFARVAFGDGYFYFHTNPLLFTNIHLVEDYGKDYASAVLSHLQEGTIYWDSYSRVPEFVGKNQNTPGTVAAPSSTPLKYILSQASLAWAWYLSLALAMLYLIFGAKRKQRRIPVLEENKNTSLEFISTIGSLYFIQNDHRKLSLQKLKLFHAFVRNRYHIPAKEMDDIFVERLATKSEVDKAIINRIALFQKNIYSSNFVSEKTLIDLHQIMDQFYKTCK